MDTHPARKALSVSLSRDSSTPDYGAPDREAFLSVKRRELEARAIEPVPVTAVTSQWAREHGEFPGESYEMVAVASEGNTWLLYDLEEEAFSLANLDDSGRLVLVGHRSRDALAEWCG